MKAMIAQGEHFIRELPSHAMKGYSGELTRDEKMQNYLLTVDIKKCS